MLRGLGRWLRAAGYDTKIVANRMADLEILETAIKEKRLILTRDQSFAKLKRAEKHVTLLKANLIKDCVQELNQLLSLNWLYKPFSRCLVCNSELEITNDETHSKKAPQGIEVLWYCPMCKKIYWQASHTKRMQQKLIQFQGLR